MSFDPTWLFVSLIPSSCGFVLMAYGKKQGRWPHAVAGLLLIVYPYVTDSLGALIGVGIAIGVGLWYAVRQGW